MSIRCCSRKCETERRKQRCTIVERFVRRVYFTETCWLWSGSYHDFGYGWFVRLRDGQWSTDLAHRVSYELFNGSIPDGQIVRHTCNVPPCVHPDHLVLGSPADNTRDMMNSGRHISQVDRYWHPPRGEDHYAYKHPEKVLRGSRHGRARITEEDVVAIRTRAFQGERYSDLGREFGLTGEGISAIVRGITWKHVPLTP